MAEKVNGSWLPAGGIDFLPKLAEGRI